MGLALQRSKAASEMAAYCEKSPVFRSFLEKVFGTGLQQVPVCSATHVLYTTVYRVECVGSLAGCGEGTTTDFKQLYVQNQLA